jgi:hypothetical protein
LIFALICSTVTKCEKNYLKKIYIFNAKHFAILPEANQGAKYNFELLPILIVTCLFEKKTFLCQFLILES